MKNEAEQVTLFQRMPQITVCLVREYVKSEEVKINYVYNKNKMKVQGKKPLKLLMVEKLGKFVINIETFNISFVIKAKFLRIFLIF